MSDKQVGAALAGFDAAMTLPTYRAKKGPGGGLEADAGSAAFLLTAHLIAGQHRGIAQRTLHISFAQYAPPDGQDPLCSVTGMRMFGDAFEMLLTDRRAFDCALEIRVSPDPGTAVIVFAPSGGKIVSKFMIPGKAKPDKLFFRENVLVIRGLPWLFDAVNDVVGASAKAMAPA